MGECEDGSERDGRLLMMTLDENSLCYAAKYGIMYNMI